MSAPHADENGSRIEVVKLRRGGAGNSVMLTIPQALAEKFGLVVGAAFLAVRAIGPCIVISKAEDVTPEGLRGDADRNFSAAIRSFHGAAEK